MVKRDLQRRKEPIMGFVFAGRTGKPIRLAQAVDPWWAFCYLIRQKYYMKKYLLMILLVTFIVPSVALASWWNPFTWKIFQKRHTKEVQVEKPAVATMETRPIAEIKQPEVETEAVVKVVPKKDNPGSESSSWKLVEDYLLPIADGQGLTGFRTISTNDVRFYTKKDNKWSWQNKGNEKVGLFGGPNSIIGNSTDTLVCNLKTYALCPAGQQFTCSEAGSASCIPNSISMQKDFTRPAAFPSPEEIRKLMVLCNLDPSIMEKLCRNDQLMNSFFMNIADTRKLIVVVATDIEKKIADRKTQSDLDLQRYQLYRSVVSQPIIFPPTHVETYSMPTFVPMYQPKPFVDPSPAHWKVQWTGNGGGFISNSSGKSTHFQCDPGSNSCFSY